MASSQVFSFYDAAAVAEPAQELSSSEASPACNIEEASEDVDIDAEEEQRDDVEAEATIQASPVEIPYSMNQWVDRANALNEIRKLLKEEIEQDSGEFFLPFFFTKHLFFNTNILSTYADSTHKQQPCLPSSTR